MGVTRDSHAVKTAGKTSGKAAGRAGGASKAKWVLPFAASCLGLLLASLLMMPMLKMSPKDVPVGLLSLDAGVTVSGTQVNVGDAMVEQLTGEGDGADDEAAAEDDAEGAEGDAAADDTADAADDATGAADADAASALDGLSLFGGEESGTSSGYVTSDAVNWIVVGSEQELEALLDSGEVYATLTIPADFSERIAASAGRTALGTQLVERLPQLAEGASALDDGAAALADGSGTLASGVSQLSSGASSLQSGLGALPSAAATAQSGAASLGEGLAKLESGAASLGEGALKVKGGNEATQKLIAAALASLGDNPDDAAVAAACAYLERAATVVEGVDEGADALAAGASSLQSGLAASKAGATSLSEGLGALASGTTALASGAGSLTSGVSKLESGAFSLASGAESLANGTDTLAEGLGTANQTLGELPEEASADPSVKLVINQGKNPMVSNSLGSAISSMASSSGVSFDIEYKNPLPTGMSMGFTHMILMMLTYLSSYITAVVVSRTFELKRGGARQVLASVGAQVCYAAACALAIGFCAAGIISAATGAAVSFVDLALFVALASFAFQMLVLGALDLFGMAGMVVPIGLLVIGMGAAYLPTEFLPAFWQNWIYPWDPLRFMADGYRGIMYMGQGFWNASSPALLVMVAVGAVLVALKVALDARGKAS